MPIPGRLLVMSFFPKDPRQRIRFRRSLFAIVLAILLTAFIWAAGAYGMMRMNWGSIVTALGILWIGNLTLLGAIRSGFNLRFRDPSLTMVQVIWATTWVLTITYYVHDVRAALLMMCLLAINFGAFRFNLAQLMGVAAYAVGGYLIVIYLLYVNHPQSFGLQLELFVLAGFAAALFGTTIVGNEMNGLRKAINERNRQLERALESVQRLSVTDDLTRIRNRRYIDETLERQAALAHRGDFRFSICFFDLDTFKEINDTYGHAVGDEVLVRVARIAASTVRTGDYLGRYGGEEFVIILPATGVDHAEAFAERLRQIMEKSKFDPLPQGRVTISCGVAEYRPPESVDDLMARADKAMFEAKKKGRNAVVCG